MDKPSHRLARLIGALADLADQEAAAVAMRDYASVFSIQERAAPIVAALSLSDANAADAGQRERLAAVIAKRTKTTATIEQHLALTREQLSGLQRSLRQVANVAPVYGQQSRRPSRLAAIG